MQTYRVLMIVTSADRMGKAPEPTGYWLEEVVGPYYAFTDARCEVTIASPMGGKAPCDPRSLAEDNHTASTRRYDVDAKAQAALAHTIKLSSVDASGYDALYFPGGHGTMDDFPNDTAVKTIVESFYRAGKPIAAVCHGPAALVSAVTNRGEPIIKGHDFTCFTDEEERLVGADASVPFLLETKLRQLGGTAQNAEPFTANVVIDFPLLTGQNPASSIPLAESVIHQLRRKMAA